MVELIRWPLYLNAPEGGPYGLCRFYVREHAMIATCRDLDVLVAWGKARGHRICR